MSILPIGDHEPENTEQVNHNGKRSRYTFLFVILILVFIAVLYRMIFA